MSSTSLIRQAQMTSLTNRPEAELEWEIDEIERDQRTTTLVLGFESNPVRASDLEDFPDWRLGVTD
jgi:hypothetical protein